jgi:hypothetical protein
MKYLIYGTIEVEIEGTPKCLWCEEPVLSPSMDGPLVCGSCDMGRLHDGTKWSPADYERLRLNFYRRIAEYTNRPDPLQWAEDALAAQRTKELTDALKDGWKVEKSS